MAMHRYAIVFCMLSLLVIGIFACSDTASAPLSPAESIGAPQPLCQLGCFDPDPTPPAPGVSLGSGVTPLLCTNGGSTDSDADGLSDFCEKEIAAAFAPILIIGQTDRAGMEPKWVARPLVSGKVEVLYLLSYYTDDGPTTTWCNNNIVPQFSAEACAGHFGDSEAIGLDVYYDKGSQHWVLDQGIFSVHTGYNIYARGLNAYPTELSYDDRIGGAPKVYVSYQKHANYPSDADCDRGSFIVTDVCVDNVFLSQVYAPAYVNLGSRFHHSAQQDCWRSWNPIYADVTRTECYWTSKRFGGWNDGQPNASPYLERMDYFGF